MAFLKLFGNLGACFAKNLNQVSHRQVQRVISIEFVLRLLATFATARLAASKICPIKISSLFNINGLRGF